jgi:hypothetical protein
MMGIREAARGVDVLHHPTKQTLVMTQTHRAYEYISMTGDECGENSVTQ